MTSLGYLIMKSKLFSHISISVMPSDWLRFYVPLNTK